MGEPAGVRHWLNFWDDGGDRDVVRKKLLYEVEKTLSEMEEV